MVRRSIPPPPLSTRNHTSDISYSVICSGTLAGMLLTSGCVFPSGMGSEGWDGTLFTMEAEQNASDKSEDVLANLMFTLESVRFDGPVVTEENYQTQIHVSEVLYRDVSFRGVRGS